MKQSMTQLEQLAKQYHSDKFGHHDYCRHYQHHLQPFQYDPITLIELGVGGYEFPDRGGSGLRMWNDFFIKGKIVGVDFYDKSGLQLPSRVQLFKGSQADGDFLMQLMCKIGEPTVIIDDASHMNQLTIQSFKHLFPWLKSGGYYIIEDIESSWWNEHGFDGDPDYCNLSAATTINFTRMLLNEVNAKHVPGFEKKYGIESMHFYQNIVFIKKA